MLLVRIYIYIYIIVPLLNHGEMNYPSTESWTLKAFPRFFIIREDSNPEVYELNFIDFAEYHVDKVDVYSSTLHLKKTCITHNRIRFFKLRSRNKLHI